jgi:hypothetical protein
VVVDVPSPEEFRQGHIPGARSLSLDEQGDRFRELPRREAIILYCSCPLSEIGPVCQCSRFFGYANLFRPARPRGVDCVPRAGQDL